MKFSIIYGTNSGSTKIVAELIEQALKSEGHSVARYNARDTQASEFRDADVVLIGSCSWELVKGKERLEGQLQQHWLELITRLKGEKFSGQKFAVFALGDSGFQHFCGAATHLEAFVKKVGGKQVGESLKVDSFYFDPENRRRIRQWVSRLLKVLARDY